MAELRFFRGEVTIYSFRSHLRKEVVFMDISRLVFMGLEGMANEVSSTGNELCYIFHICTLWQT